MAEEEEKEEESLCLFEVTAEGVGEVRQPAER